MAERPKAGTGDRMRGSWGPRGSRQGLRVEDRPGRILEATR